jgi:hypothetical protein
MVRTHRNALGFVVALALATAFPARARAQRTAADSARAVPTHMLRTRDGSTLLGRLVAETPDTIRFETAGGLLVLPRASVAELRRIDSGDVHDGEYWFPDPNSTRLFFAPTGRMLKRGEGYFNDTYVVLLQFVAGLTDNVTLGGGFSVIPSSDLTQNVLYLSPKIGLISTGDLDVAVGALVGFAGHTNGSGGVLYGVATKGGPDGSVSVGTGWLYSGKNVSSNPVFMLGGGLRISRRATLISENYVFSGFGTHAAAMYGVRFFGEKLSVDLAFVNAFGRDVNQYFPGIPYVAFSTRF